MRTQLDAHSLLSQHTFGRNHFQPPPLSRVVQMESASQVSKQMGDDQSGVMGQKGGLPDDFDHMVRSIGEW